MEGGMEGGRPPSSSPPARCSFYSKRRHFCHFLPALPRRLVNLICSLALRWKCQAARARPDHVTVEAPPAHTLGGLPGLSACFPSSLLSSSLHSLSWT